MSTFILELLRPKSETLIDFTKLSDYLKVGSVQATVVSSVRQQPLSQCLTVCLELSRKILRPVMSSFIGCDRRPGLALAPGNLWKNVRVRRTTSRKMSLESSVTSGNWFLYDCRGRILYKVILFIIVTPTFCLCLRLRINLCLFRGVWTSVLALVCRTEPYLVSGSFRLGRAHLLRGESSDPREWSHHLRDPFTRTVRTNYWPYRTGPSYTGKRWTKHNVVYSGRRRLFICLFVFLCL